MQSSMVVAGMDFFTRENILTRRANQGHYLIIPSFVKCPWPYPDNRLAAAFMATTAASLRINYKFAP
jgi:hypothetical protein